MTAVYQCAHEWGATIAVVAFFLFTIPGTRASAQTYLYNRAEFPTGNGPSAVVTADFNGDGIPDIAVANSNDNTVSILLGQPNGGFAKAVEYGTGPSPSALVVGDFNGDGKLDLAVVVRECVLNSSLTAGRLLFGDPMGRARRLEPGSRSCNGNPIDLSTGAATMLAR